MERDVSDETRYERDDMRNIGCKIIRCCTQNSRLNVSI